MGDSVVEVETTDAAADASDAVSETASDAALDYASDSAFDLAALEGELQAGSAAPSSSAQQIASKADEIEIGVEEFLSESLVTEASHVLESAKAEEKLAQRREARERMERVEKRAQEILKELECETRHEEEIRELEAAISTADEPVGEHSPEEDARERGEEEEEEAPYVADDTEFIDKALASSKMGGLKEEIDLIERCLKLGHTPDAFAMYLRGIDD